MHGRHELELRPGRRDGVTANYSAFLEKMLAPIGKTQPYYAIDLAAADATWTAKFVFVAANAWSSAQEAWLESALAKPSTYTFVVRHEPASCHERPGVTPSEPVMARHPYTLAIVGHSHTYAHDPETPRQVLVGNGGAPLTSKDYGFALFSQRPDGVLDVDMLQWQTRCRRPVLPLRRPSRRQRGALKRPSFGRRSRSCAGPELCARPDFEATRRGSPQSVPRGLAGARCGVVPGHPLLVPDRLAIPAGNAPSSDKRLPCVPLNSSACTRIRGRTASFCRARRSRRLERGRRHGEC